MIPPLMLGQLCRMINTQLEYHSLYKFEHTCGLCPYVTKKQFMCCVSYLANVPATWTPTPVGQALKEAYHGVTYP